MLSSSVFSSLLFAVEGVNSLRLVDWLPSIAVGVLLILGLITFTYSTKAGIIARATTKEAVRQPIFLLCMALAIVSLALNYVLPYFSLGEDVKMLKDCGMATILITGLLIAVWTASTSVADEIDGKTAMTLLSKPINRRQFVLGKYIGILQTILWYMLPVVTVFLVLIYFKVGYDAKEGSKDAPLHAERIQEVYQVLPGIVLLMMEIAVMSAISVAISTRLPMVVNLTSCFAIFVVGHLTGLLVQAGVLKLEYVQFMARLIATALPSLDLFNISAAVATGDVVPPIYLGFSAIYCACYCGAAILMAFILFEDRDLA
ncbi:MAG: ABC transporter permease [Planctomycetota bacterium]|jgi:ABC-type transport system involved in multi-copper enzyme maturation permease subunit|nr:MAG: ABC transporter permease [Planctomycetota bacterium]RLS81690.1 MAG: ABC transporter permease [Planctomycetota bacterium]